jgi:HAMP domain-containing protein
MGFNPTKGLADKAKGSARSITQKIAITVIVINLLGLVVISFAISQMSGASQMATAERNWLKDTAQIGAQAAGGVKWGKTEAIRSAYEIFQNDPKLALVGFTAFNQAGDQVDVWSRSETPDTGLAQVLNANPGEMKEATIEEGSSWVVVSAPLPAGKDGVSLGQIKTVWSTDDIAMSSRDFALKAMASQIAVLIIAVAILLFAMRKFVGRPLADVNQRIGELQAGDITTPVPHAEKGDEIGVVARALTEFCDAARQKLEADAEMARQREQLDAERQANMSETERSSRGPAQSCRRAGNRTGEAGLGRSYGTGSRPWWRVCRAAGQFQQGVVGAGGNCRHHRQRPACRQAGFRQPGRLDRRTGAPDRTASGCAGTDRCGARRDHRNGQGFLRASDRSRRSCRLDPGCRDFVFADRPFGDHGDGWNRRVLLENRADSQGDRRHCLPDQPSGPECRCGSGASRRSRQGLCRGRAGSA